MSEIHRHNLKKAIIFVLFAWAFFSTMALLVRLSSPRVATSVFVFALNLIGFLCTLPVMMRYGWQDLKTKRIGLITFRALTGLGGFTFLFLAVQKISLTNAILLNNAAPLMLPLIIRVWCKIKIDRRLWIGIIIGFTGICFILKPGQALLDLGALYGLGAACCLALGMVSVRLLSYTEKHHTVLFYFFLIASVLSAPFAIQDWKPIEFIDFINLILIGAFAFLGQLCFIKAFHNAKASQIGPFSYVGVVFGFIFDVIFFNAHPDIFSIIGAILVIGGGVLTILFTKPATLQKS